MRIEYHRTLIADEVRLAQIEAALKRVIEPGRTTVADIGTGSGILAMIAARLGASRVYAYEMAEIGALAERLVRLNKFRQIEVIPGRASDVIDPPRVDVVVSETLGNYALEENILAVAENARKRHLKPRGVLIPSRITQLVAPVITSRWREELVAWDRVGRGLDLGPARDMSLNNAYVRRFAPADLLGRGVQWDEIDLMRDARGSRRGEVRWDMREPATVYGLALWWTAELIPGIALSTSPSAPATHWEQLFLPALEPITVPARHAVVAEVRSRSSLDRGTDIAWTLRAIDARGRETARQSLSLEKGYIP